MHALTSLFTRLCTRYPLLGGIFGLVMAVMFGFLGFSSWQEMKTMPQEPLRLSPAEAIAAVEATGEDQWVTIEAVVWDCDNIVPMDSSRARALFTDEAGTVLGVATVSRPRGSDVICSDLGPYEINGVVRPLSQGEYDRLDDTGFDLTRYGNATQQVALCTLCGPGNAQILLILSAILVLGGLALYPMCLHLRREQQARPGAFR